MPEARQLPALLRESVKHQEDITEALGIQVRQAVELLVAAFARSDVPAETSAAEVYRGAVTVMMRLVFLLFAEESGLLPADNELYASSYSAGGLYAELEAAGRGRARQRGRARAHIPGLAPAARPVHGRAPRRRAPGTPADRARRFAVRPR